MTLKPPDGQNSENRPQGKIRREDITPETLPEGYKVALQQTGAIPEMPDWAKERFAEIWADTYAIAHFNVRRSVRPNPVCRESIETTLGLISMNTTFTMTTSFDVSSLNQF